MFMFLMPFCRSSFCFARRRFGCCSFYGNLPPWQWGVADPGPREGGEGGSEVKNWGCGDSPDRRREETPDRLERTSRSRHLPLLMAGKGGVGRPPIDALCTTLQSRAVWWW